VVSSFSRFVGGELGRSPNEGEGDSEIRLFVVVGGCRESAGGDGDVVRLALLFLVVSMGSSTGSVFVISTTSGVVGRDILECTLASREEIEG
jgi:hypothetical protein